MAKKTRRPTLGSAPSPVLGALGVLPPAPQTPKTDGKPAITDNPRRSKSRAAEDTARPKPQPTHPPQRQRARQTRIGTQPRIPEATFKRLKRLAFALKQRGVEVPLWELVAASLRTIPDSAPEALAIVETWRQGVGETPPRERRHLHAEVPHELHRRLEQIAFDLEDADSPVALWELYATALEALPDSAAEGQRLIEAYRRHGAVVISDAA